MNNPTLRPANERKTKYISSCIEEEFIVPMVGDKINAILEEFLANKKGKLALDIGCGKKPFLEIIESYNLKYHSFDVNDDGSLDFIGEIDKELDSRLIETGPFDFILCTEVLEHVADWNKTFENFSKLLAKDGYLLITAPHFYGLHEVPYDFWRPTRYAFEYYAKKVELKVIKNESTGTFWDILGTLLANTPAFLIEDKKINLKNKLICKLLNFGSKQLFRLLKSRYLHKNIKATCYMYQSNIVVIQK